MLQYIVAIRCPFRYYIPHRVLYRQNGRKQRNPATAPEFLGKFTVKLPVEFPGCWISWEIPRETGCGIQVPGEFTGGFPGNSPGNFQVPGKSPGKFPGLLDFPGNPPGGWTRQPPAREIGRPGFREFHVGINCN